MFPNTSFFVVLSVLCAFDLSLHWSACAGSVMQDIPSPSLGDTPQPQENW